MVVVGNVFAEAGCVWEEIFMDSRSCIHPARPQQSTVRPGQQHSPLSEIPSCLQYPETACVGRATAGHASCSQLGREPASLRCPAELGQCQNRAKCSLIFIKQGGSQVMSPASNEAGGQLVVCPSRVPCAAYTRVLCPCPTSCCSLSGGGKLHTSNHLMAPPHSGSRQQSGLG